MHTCACLVQAHVCICLPCMHIFVYMFVQRGVYVYAFLCACVMCREFSYAYTCVHIFNLNLQLLVQAFFMGVVCMYALWVHVCCIVYMQIRMHTYTRMEIGICIRCVTSYFYTCITFAERIWCLHVQCVSHQEPDTMHHASHFDTDTHTYMYTRIHRCT
jgi:hypothetical protein